MNTALQPLRILRLAALFALLALASGAFADWREEALLLRNAVSPNLNELRSRSTGNERLGLYADALEAMATKGIAAANRDRAARIFEELIEIRANDPIGLASRYYLIEIDHQRGDAERSLKDDYFRFYQRNPESFFGGLALVRYAMLEAYSENEKEGALRRLIALEPHLEGLEIPDLRRDFRRIMGEAYIAFELSKGKAYEHLKEAVEIGSTIEKEQADLLLKTAELAEELGRHQEAIALYQEFRESMALDPRKQDVERRIASLRGRNSG